MARLIDADELRKKIEEEVLNIEKNTTFIGTCMHSALLWVIALINRSTTIDAEPVRHCRWLKEYDGQENYSIHKCSNCGGEPYYESDIEKEYYFCPYCGARMDKKSPENHKKYQGE